MAIKRRTRDDTPWLDGEERRTWLTLCALMTLLPGTIDAELERQAQLSFFEYTVLAMLSEQPDRTLRMSSLAKLANGSLSRLSHVARRLEGRGYLYRQPLPENGRITVAVLTDEGHAAVQVAAPGHVRHVRRIVFDPLSHTQRKALLEGIDRIVTGIDPEAPWLLVPPSQG